MYFGEDRSVEVLGWRAGYAFAYLVFTAVLYMVFNAMGRLPASWSILHVAAVTLLITAAGVAVRRFLR